MATFLWQTNPPSYTMTPRETRTFNIDLTLEMASTTVPWTVVGGSLVCTIVRGGDDAQLPNSIIGAPAYSAPNVSVQVGNFPGPGTYYLEISVLASGTGDKYETTLTIIVNSV